VKPTLLVVTMLGIAMVVPTSAPRAQNGQPTAVDAGRLRQAAERGDAAAQYNLGVLYFRGDAVVQDYVQAAQWYRKAADQGHADAQFNLGVMYFSGHGVRQNNADAVRWFRAAADQGLADAQNNLALMYANGSGVARDDVEAYKWLEIAVARTSGDDRRRSTDSRNRIGTRLTAQQVEEAQKRARDWMDEFDRRR
jgi:TPR repeat protein